MNDENERSGASDGSVCDLLVGAGVFVCIAGIMWAMTNHAHELMRLNLRFMGAHDAEARCPTAENE